MCRTGDLPLIYARIRALARRLGLEPRTKSLTTIRSTLELATHSSFASESNRPGPHYKCGALPRERAKHQSPRQESNLRLSDTSRPSWPLDHAGIVRVKGVEPLPLGWKPSALP